MFQSIAKTFGLGVGLGFVGKTTFDLIKPSLSNGIISANHDGLHLRKTKYKDGIHLDGMEVWEFKKDDALTILAQFNVETGQVGCTASNNPTGNPWWDYSYDKTIAEERVEFGLKAIIKEIKERNPEREFIWETICSYPQVWERLGASFQKPTLTDEQFNTFKKSGLKQGSETNDRGKAGGYVLYIKNL